MTATASLHPPTASPHSSSSVLPLLLLLLSALFLCHHLPPVSALTSRHVELPQQRTDPTVDLLTSSNASSLSSKLDSVVGAAPTGTLRFTLITENAEWSARSIGAVEWFPKPVTYYPQPSVRKTISANAFVLHGGSGAGNDVWVSGDHGATWDLASGWTVDEQRASSPYDERSFINYGAAAVLLDGIRGIIYRIGGRVDATTETDAVWSSTNAITWTNAADNSRAPFESQRFYAGAVATSKGDVILQGGTYNNFRAYQSDVWLSTTQGKTWRLQTAAAAFGTRGIGVLLSSQHADRLDGADILYLIGGQNEKDNSNEVWISSDGGRQWWPVNLRGPFAQRDAFNGEITPDGVIIISAGLADRDVGLNESPINDVWVSLDGGYTWGQCVEDAEWSDRYLQFTLLDERGYFYVVGGRTFEGGRVTQFNDVWRSSISFNDINAIARTCNVVPPACGVGLRCFPTGDTVVAADGSFVSCAACPHPDSQSSSTAVNVQTILLTVFIALFVVTFLFLALVLYRLRKSASHSDPLLGWWWLKGSSKPVTDRSEASTLTSYAAMG